MYIYYPVYIVYYLSCVYCKRVFAGVFKAFRSHFLKYLFSKEEAMAKLCDVCCVESNLGQIVEFFFLWHSLLVVFFFL